MFIQIKILSIINRRNERNAYKKNVLKLSNFKDKSKDSKIELSNEVLNNIPILIGTINDLINVINLRIELTDAEKECIQTIKTNVDEIKKIF